MLGLLTSAKEPALQQAIINALAEIDAPAAELALVKLARTGDVDARRHAIEALGERAEDDRGSASTIASLIGIYDSEKDERLKEEIIDVFRESLDTAALKKLMQIASADASVRLRKAALAAIADSEHPGAVRLLEDILTK
jgi:HEAT repeat protein